MEGPLEDITIAENLKQWWRLLDEEATREEGDILQHSPYQLLEDKQHFGGEDCNIPN